MDNRLYQWNASDYAIHSSVQFQWAEELIGKLELHGDESVLDIGCGDGKVTARIAVHLPHGFVVGIDNSIDMIELAKRNFSKKKQPNLSFEPMDASDIQYVSRFDIAFSNAALHWVVDHRPVLDGVYKSLKTKGRILFQMGGKGNAEEVVEAFDLLIGMDPWRQYFSGFPFPYGFFTPREYRRFLIGAGFDPRRLELIPKDMLQKGREGLAGWIRTTWLPYVERVPAHLRETFVNETVESYLRTHPPDFEGLVHIRMIRLEIEAIKQEDSKHSL
jgi:trans-aconitate 2-methyltransferase